MAELQALKGAQAKTQAEKETANADTAESTESKE